MACFLDMRKTALICALLAFVTLGAYWPVVRHDFINYDDPEYVTENPIVAAGLSWKGVVWAFQTFHSGNWHPLTWLSHMIDCRLFGLKPGWHHLTSLLLHLANTLLLFLVLNRMTTTTWKSAFVAAFFALHPLHVESAAWVAERKDVLSAFFGLLALYTYVSYTEESKVKSSKSAVHGPQSTTDGNMTGASIPESIEGPVHQGVNRFYLLALGFFALGLMSKPMLVTWPCVLLLLDFWPLHRIEFSGDGPALSVPASVLWEKLPFFLLSIISSTLTIWAQRAGHSVISLDEFPLYSRFANALINCLGYLRQIFWPSHLAVFYPYQGDPSYVQLALAGTLISGLTVLAILNAKRFPFLTVGWLWYLGTLVPVLGLVQVGLQAHADRYTYLPFIGIFVFLVWSSSHICRGARERMVLVVGGSLALGACLALSSSQLKHWRNSKSLFAHAREVTEDNYLACTILGSLLAQEGRMNEAVGLLEEALSYKGNYPDSYICYGNVLERLGKFEEAATYYSEAIRMNPVSARARQGLGSALAHQGRFAEAIEHYSFALQDNPASWEAEAGLGLALEAEERFQEALPYLNKLVEHKPANAEAHFSLATALAETGQTNQAQGHYAAALRLDPELADKLFESGKSLAAAGQPRAAMSRFWAVLRLRPSHVDAHEQLGLLFAQQGNIAEALLHFTEVAKARPDAQAHYNLALAFAIEGKASSAVQHYRKALELKADWPAALNDLAWILATHPQDEVRNGAEAVRLAERACQLTGQREARFLGTLDAAYAEVGRFDEAIATAHKAQDMASACGQPEIAQAAQERINAYESREPYRQK